MTISKKVLVFAVLSLVLFLSGVNSVWNTYQQVVFLERVVLNEVTQINTVAEQFYAQPQETFSRDVEYCFATTEPHRHTLSEQLAAYRRIPAYSLWERHDALLNLYGVAQHRNSLQMGALVNPELSGCIPFDQMPELHLQAAP